MIPLPDTIPLLKQIVDRDSIGIFVVDKDNNVTLWNNFMESHSGVKSSALLGKNLFDSFPELPRAWLEQKISNVFLLKNFSFTSWEHRPYLFKFQHNRPITGGSDHMKQDCTFLPVKGGSGDVEYVCIIVHDATDISIYESMLKEAVKSLAEASNKDGLTGTFNRRFLEHSLSTELNRAIRYGNHFSFMIVDLDHFKNVNDTYGHLAGDAILREAAKRLSFDLRASDVLARYGGEEFALVLPETDLNGAKILAERLREHLAEKPVMFADKEISVTASVGVTEYCSEITEYQQIIDKADSALYASKENGRNRVTVCLPCGALTDINGLEKTTGSDAASTDPVKYVTIGHK